MEVTEKDLEQVNKDVVATGVRQRLKIADVMVNQLEISSSSSSNQRVLLAASNHPDGAGSSNDHRNDPDPSLDKQQAKKIAQLEAEVTRIVQRLHKQD